MLRKICSKKMAKALLSFVLVAVMIVSCKVPGHAAAYKITVDGAGINNYNLCGHGNRAGKTYVYGLVSGLQEKYHPLGIPVESSVLEDNACTKNAVIAAANKDATMFVFGGHGKAYNTSTDDSLHLNINSANKLHRTMGLGELNKEINVLTTELTQNKHRYFVAYSCNFLTNSGSTTKVENMYKIGARVLCGFATSMYLDSREGLYFGRLLGNVHIRASKMRAK